MVHPRVIHLAILEPDEPDYLKQVAESIEVQFDLEVTVGNPLGVPHYALDPVRKQYNSNLILVELTRICPHHAVKILGMTSVDLFSPIFTYVFGEALFHGKSAVISRVSTPSRPQIPPCPTAVPPS